MRTLVAFVLMVGACRGDRRARSVARRTQVTDRAHAQSVTPACDAPPETPRVLFEARDVTGWLEVAPGVRWRKATVRVIGTVPAVARIEAAPDELVWAVVRVDVTRAALSVERSPGDSIAMLWERDRGAVAIVDAGFFEPDHRASGLVVSRGVLVSPMGARGGTGILRLANDRVDVVSIDARDGGTFNVAPEVSLALQCGPRLVEPGGLHGIRRHDGHFYARTAVCVRDGGRTLDLIVTWDLRDELRGPELYDFATMLAGASPVGDREGCEAALNLDGGPSTGVYVRDLAGGVGFRHAPIGPTPWALVVRARSPRRW